VIVNDHDAVRAEEIVPVDGIRSLRLHAPESGGIYVRQSCQGVGRRGEIPRGGRADFQTSNGPISVRDVDATVTARTENGPISVDLRETSWTGGRLDARTDNGPLSLQIPRGYRSGVTVDTDGNSPVKCRAEDCRNGRVKFEDDDSRWPRHIDLGRGPHAVTVATSNGPVSINER
jgi:DUF4097 and DUF4098 domain-containing protein YvlB